MEEQKKRYLKITFKDFFEVMALKLLESKQAKEDVIFEDKERNVSCFLW